MPNNLQDDLDEILITGADKAETRAHLLSKGYDPDVVEQELSKIPFVNEKKKSSNDAKTGSKTKKVKAISIVVILLLLIGGVVLKLKLSRKYKNKTYAQINVQICNSSRTPVVVETNFSKALNSPYVNGGCLGTVVGQELPIDYLYTEQMSIKISVNGKSKTFNNGSLDSMDNIFARAEIQKSPGKKGWFSNQEIQHVVFTISDAEVAACE